MRLPSEEELILHYYGESDRAEEIERLLATSDEARRRYAEIRSVLDAVETEPVPARSDLYGHEIWRRVRPRLERPLENESSRWLSLPKAVGWAVAATLLIAVSFWAGRETAPPVADLSALSDEARDRILLAAVADHLERSQFLLLEITNAEGADLSDSGLTTARDLTAQNRLFRRAAQNEGEAEVELVLGELERYLTELSHLPAGATEEVAGFARRVEQNNLIFKVRVLGSRLDERAQRSEASPTT